MKQKYINNSQKWVFSGLNVADYPLISEDQPLVFGKRLRDKIQEFWIYSYSFVKFFYFYLRQFFYRRCREEVNIKSVILHSGRGYDLRNFHKVCNFSDKDSIQFNVFNIDNFIKYKRLGLQKLMKNFSESVLQYQQILTNNFQDDLRKEILRIGPKILPMYSYLKTFFREVIDENPDCIAYSGGSLLVSHASISAGMKTIYVPHGMIPKISPDLFPKYDSIYVYSVDERKYLLDIGIKSSVQIYPVRSIATRNKRVVFFMPTSFPNFVSKKDQCKIFLELTNLFKLFDYEIYIKLHSIHNSPAKFLSEYGYTPLKLNDILDLSVVTVISNKKDAEAVIEDVQPSFAVAGWGSTTLCESINMGVIPISITATRSEKDLFSVIYKVNNRSLLWPLEVGVIQDALKDDLFYDDVIKMLKTGDKKLLSHHNNSK